MPTSSAQTWTGGSLGNRNNFLFVVVVVVVVIVFVVNIKFLVVVVVVVVVVGVVLTRWNLSWVIRRLNGAKGGVVVVVVVIVIKTHRGEGERQSLEQRRRPRPPNSRKCGTSSNHRACHDQPDERI